MFPKLKLSSEEIDAYLSKVSKIDIMRSLEKNKKDFFDLLNLISPAATNEIFVLREASKIVRQAYFGKTVSVFAPLYISNTCINSCKYCDFNIHHKAARKTLTIDEIIKESIALKNRKIDSVLILTGEDPIRSSVDFLCETGKILKKMFSYTALEIAPQNEEDYKKLYAAGYDGVVCFQETYDRKTYKQMHPAGPKSDYDFRVWTQLRAGNAGFRNLGIAFLGGLAPWRREAASLCAHAFYLMRECYESKIQFSFPRITPTSDGFIPPHTISESDLEQMMLAFRIVFPQAPITISTRESPIFRDNVISTCANIISVGSCVTPGGYAVNADRDVAQFTLNDTRKPSEIYDAIRATGQDVVFKVWDNRI